MRPEHFATSFARTGLRRAPRPAVLIGYALVLGACIVVAAVALVIGPAPAQTTRAADPKSGAATPAGSAARPSSSVQISEPRSTTSCAISVKLVPACGRWWGVAPLPYSGTPVSDALRTEEKLANRPMDVVHVYHRNGQLFPTAGERAVALKPGHQRLLMINWKPDTSLPWRAVADGANDARIDALAAHIQRTFRHPFFLTIWHEPENDVREVNGSGYTAADYAAMYRHVIGRLRADGVTYAITVMDYIGAAKWALMPWFDQLYPGDNYVDWIGIDPYGGGVGTSVYDFASLVDLPSSAFPGYYTWAVRTHPGKPIMLAEWGVISSSTDVSGQARLFRSVRDQLSRFPMIKALFYFDIPNPPAGQPNTFVDQNAASLAAYRVLASSNEIRGPRWRYAT